MAGADTGDWLLSVAACLAGVAVALLVAPWSEWVAKRCGAVDEPDEERRVHQGRIPRLGGLALALGTIPGVLVAIKSAPGQHGPLVGTLAGGLVVFLIGSVDDCRRLPWWLKLAGIVGAAALAVSLGVRISVVRNPFGEGFTGLGWSAGLVTGAWIVVLTNAFNLIDGLDGLAAGLASISGASLVAMALSKGGALLPVGFVAAGLAGAALGFLYFNFNPARMFMGDGGAYFVGFTLACLSVTGAMKTPVAITLVIPLLVFAIPLADTTLAVLRRLARRQPIMAAPDRQHLHHRLLDMGLSQRQVVVAIYIVSAIFCAWAVALYAG